MPTGKKIEGWTTRLFIGGLGVFILYLGWANPVDWAAGVPFSVGPPIESVEFRNAFKLTINRVSGGKYFQQVEQKNIRADNVITVQGDPQASRVEKSRLWCKGACETGLHSALEGGYFLARPRYTHFHRRDLVESGIREAVSHPFSAPRYC